MVAERSQGRAAKVVWAPAEVGLKTNGLAQGSSGVLESSLLFENRAQGVVCLGIVGAGWIAARSSFRRLVKLPLLPSVTPRV